MVETSNRYFYSLIPEIELRQFGRFGDLSGHACGRSKIDGQKVAKLIPFLLIYMTKAPKVANFGYFVLIPPGP